MTWQIEWQDGGMSFIARDAGVVAGSIVTTTEGAFRIEVLWTGPGGDIVWEARSKAEAEAFVAGVGAMFEACLIGAWGGNLLPAESVG